MSDTILIEKEQNYIFAKVVADSPEMLEHCRYIKFSNFDRKCEGMRGYTAVDVEYNILNTIGFFKVYNELYIKYTEGRYR